MIQPEQEIKQLIDNLRPKHGSIPAEWENVQAQLLSMIQSIPNLANDSEIICSIVIFASKLTDSNAMKVFTNCISQRIGDFHSLMFSAIALIFEKQNNYISSLSTFEQANKTHVEPYQFLELKYSEFKKRMCDRFISIMNHKGSFNDTFTLDLGTLDGIEYIFNNGRIVTKPKTNEAARSPIIDVFGIIGFNASSITPMNLTAHNSFASINNSNIASKPESYVSGFDPDLLTGPDDKECSFEEQRLLSLGINFIENRKLNIPVNNQQSNPDSPVDRPVLPKKPRNRKPLQPLDQPAQHPHFQKSEQIDPVDASFSFNEAAKPRSILKKTQNTFGSNNNNNNSVSINKNNTSFNAASNNSVSINKNNNSNNNNSLSFINSNNENNNSSIHPISISPRNSRSGMGVTFSNPIQSAPAERRRSPTPITRPSSILLENEAINSGSNIIGNLVVQSQIGDHAYLAKMTTKDQLFVVKRLTYSDSQNQALSFFKHVQHPELFALQADTEHQSPDFFITNFFPKGSLEVFISALRKGDIKFDQNVSLFFLLQMILILQQLETNGFVHGEINEKNLLMRIPVEQLSQVFGINEPGWKDSGIVLIRCDQIQRNARKVDREAVYNVFINLSISEDSIRGGFVQYDCPKLWNKSIWKLIFDTLSTETTLDPLMALIIKELEKSCKTLRSKIATMFYKFYQ